MSNARAEVFARQLKSKKNPTRPRTYGWHLIGDNGTDIIATDGGQGYSSRREAERMMYRVLTGHYAGAAADIEPPEG